MTTSKVSSRANALSSHRVKPAAAHTPEFDVSRPVLQSQPIEVARNPSALLKASTIIALMGVSRSHFYALVAAGKFPPASARLSPKCVRWRASDVTAWLDAQGAA